jgi:hypothetical protein
LGTDSKKIPPTTAQTQKVKNYAPLSLLIGCMEFLFPKRVGHHFQPGLIPPIINWWALVALVNNLKL